MGVVGFVELGGGCDYRCQKINRFTHDSGSVFEVRYDTADAMSFETVSDPVAASSARRAPTPSMS
ncbi:hypothetical protein NN3_13160 [Nocardia neocaledoniensis NBRC 108232]|nr:hypothetical protein NN3_13160 [Nocardia neocaledoniensis NBRC 108232]